MSKTKFLAARELIKEKKYAEARAILNTIDHPTARAWLSKLDELESQPRKQRSQLGIMVIVILLIVFISLSVAIVVLIVRRPVEAPVSTSTSTNLSQIVYVYCTQEYKVDEQCTELTRYIIDNYSDDVDKCYETFGSALNDMGSCLRPQFQVAYNTVWKPYLTSGTLTTFCNTWVAQTGTETRPTRGCEQWSVDVLAVAPAQAVDNCFQIYLAFDVDPSQFRDSPAWEFSVNCLARFIDEETWNGGSAWLPSYRPSDDP